MQTYKNRQLDIACNLLKTYTGTPNLDVYLQAEFKKNKQFGSKDRRFYREICFQYYRRAAGSELSIELLESLLQDSVQSTFNPYKAYALSMELNSERLSSWFQKKPPFYIFGELARIQALYNKLEIDGVHVEWHKDYIKSFDLINAQNYPEITSLQIMDLGSYSSILNLPIKSNSTVWDACSGSGGKSLAIQRVYGPKRIVCSDVRNSVLNNLKQRFNGNSNAIEIKQMDASIDFEQADLILIDAPCSGSGTWRRSPDRAAFFTDKDLERVHNLQAKILENIISKAAVNTIIVYLTCSVFELENEAHIANTATKLGAELISKEIIGGIDIDSDYLYRAVFKKIN